MTVRSWSAACAITALVVAFPWSACGKKKGGGFDTNEPMTNLQKIGEGAKVYFEMGPKMDRSGKAVPVQFPASIPLFPAKKCCLQKDRLCQPEAPGGDFSKNPTLMALGFQILDAHAYQYRFRSSGTGTQAKFTAQAVADPKCDGKYLVLELKGHVDGSQNVVVGKITTRKNVTNLD